MCSFIWNIFIFFGTQVFLHTQIVNQNALVVSLSNCSDEIANYSHKTELVYIDRRTWYVSKQKFQI